jgi:hypothetical protein
VGREAGGGPRTRDGMVGWGGQKFEFSSLDKVLRAVLSSPRSAGDGVR